jgi:hypothetical protein
MPRCAVLALAFALIPSSVCADAAFVVGPTEDFTAESVPADGAVFPADAAPLIRVGDGHFRRLIDAVPTLIHVATDLVVPAGFEQRSFTTESGSVEWLRLPPDELLIEGDEYVLGFIDPETGEFTNSFPPRTFEAGPPDTRIPVAADIDVHIVDEGSQPGYLGRSGPVSGRHRHRLHVSSDVDSADFGIHDTWMLFQVSEDFDGDLGSTPPKRWLMPAEFPGETDIASWDYDAPDGDGRRCAVAATEDAYGAIATSDVVCADPVLAGCEGCSSAGATPGSRIAILAMLLGVASRRRRLL